MAGVCIYLVFCAGFVFGLRWDGWNEMRWDIHGRCLYVLYFVPVGALFLVWDRWDGVGDRCWKRGGEWNGLTLVFAVWGW